MTDHATTPAIQAVTHAREKDAKAALAEVGSPELLAEIRFAEQMHKNRKSMIAAIDKRAEELRAKAEADRRRHELRGRAPRLVEIRRHIASPVRRAPGQRVWLTPQQIIAQGLRPDDYTMLSVD